LHSCYRAGVCNITFLRMASTTSGFTELQVTITLLIPNVFSEDNNVEK